MQRRPGNETIKPEPQPKLPKLAYRPAFIITANTPQGQVAGANSFNEMRERLLLLGEMEER